MKKLIKIIGAAVIAIYTLSYSNDVKAGGFFDRIDFLTEYYFNQDLRTYFNHKNDDFHETYLMSAQTEFEMMLVSYDNFFHFGLIYTNYLGMGRQNEAILFDPNEVNYALIPFFEFRRDNIFYQTGLDHRCYHEVDRSTRPTAYWNQFYIIASSANYRYRQLKNNYIDSGRDSRWDRLRWSARAGYFIREFGDMDVTLLSGGHPWGTTVGVEAMYSFYRTKSWMFSGHRKIDLLVDTTGTPYWVTVMGVEADVYNRRYSFGVFINYNYEFPRKLPLLSKDQLIELGMRFRY